MIDLCRDASLRFKLAGCLSFESSGQALDKLDEHPVRVLDFEGIVTGSRLAAIARLDVNSLGPEISTHLFYVVYCEAEMAHHVVRNRGRLVKEFDMLMVVDLDEGDPYTVSVLFLEVVRFVKA